MEYILGSVIAVLVAGLLISVWWLRQEVTARGAEQDARREADTNRAKVERERDDLKATLTRTNIERVNALAANATIEAALKKAREELKKHVLVRLENATDDDAAAEVDRLLSAEPEMPTLR